MLCNQSDFESLLCLFVAYVELKGGIGGFECDSLQIASLNYFITIPSILFQLVTDLPGIGFSFRLESSYTLFL